jgi:hypothetical protein
MGIYRTADVAQGRGDRFLGPLIESASPGAAGLFSRHWQSHHEHGGLLSCLRTLRAEGLGVAALEELRFAAQLPVGEAARFAGELDWDSPGSGRGQASWSGMKEATVLIAAMAGRDRSEVGAVLQALLDRPQRATMALMSALTAYPHDVIVAVALGLSAVEPDLLPIFVRLAASRLPEILTRDIYCGNSGLLGTYAELFKTASTRLPATDFCHLYLNLRERTLSAETDFMLAQALINPDAPEIAAELKSRGSRREAKQLSQAVRQKNG